MFIKSQDDGSVTDEMLYNAMPRVRCEGFPTLAAFFVCFLNHTIDHIEIPPMVTAVPTRYTWLTKPFCEVRRLINSREETAPTKEIRKLKTTKPGWNDRGTKWSLYC